MRTEAGQDSCGPTVYGMHTSSLTAARIVQGEEIEQEQEGSPMDQQVVKDMDVDADVSAMASSGGEMKVKDALHS